MNMFSTYLQPMDLVLLDIEPMLPILDGVIMELQDCSLPLVNCKSEVVVCDNKLDFYNHACPL